jgi:two-component system CheB/CheR fusion protein
MAFVVVLHLSPGDESHLAELIRRRTTTPVVEVNTATAIQAGRVYVLPPDRTLKVTNASLDSGRFG